MDTSVDVASQQTLPVISFAGRNEETLARQLDQAFSDIGFCYFSDIGVDPAVVEGVFAASRRFHAQPRAAKDAIAMNRFHRGYMAPKTSDHPDLERGQGNQAERFGIVHADA